MQAATETPTKHSAARVSAPVRAFLADRLSETGLFVALIVLFVVLSVTATNFLTSANLLNVLRDASFIGIVAWGMTLVIVGAEIDISVGPAVAFSSVLLAVLNARHGVPLVLAALIVCVVVTSIGLAAGFLRARFGVPSFLATLSLWLAYRGVAELMSDALPVPISSQGFQRLGNGSIGGFPIPALIMFGLFVFFLVVSKRTAFGRSVYAVGGNANAARLAGISVTRVKTALLGTTALLSAITGIILAARLGSGNSGAADGLEFDVIAAVVVGGTGLFGGRGSIVGTLMGVLFITLIGNGLVLLGVNPFAQNVVRGAIILVAVLVSSIVVKRRKE